MIILESVCKETIYHHMANEEVKLTRSVLTHFFNFDNKCAGFLLLLFFCLFFGGGGGVNIFIVHKGSDHLICLLLLFFFLFFFGGGIILALVLFSSHTGAWLFIFARYGPGYFFS